MNWIWEALIDIVAGVFIRRPDSRASMGESRMDREARWLLTGLILLIFAGIAAYKFWLAK